MISRSACVSLACFVFSVAAGAAAQTPGPSTLRVIVRDATDLGLPTASVTLTDAQGAAQQAADPQGVATFAGLQPGGPEHPRQSVGRRIELGVALGLPAPRHHDGGLVGVGVSDVAREHGGGR